MKKLFLIFLICPTTFVACHESLEEKAAREAAEFTRKNCPVAVSENIVNDSMVYEKTRAPYIIIIQSTETPTPRP